MLNVFNQTGFKLMYHDLGNTIHFSFFMMQFFPPSLKIMIPKNNFLVSFNHKEKLCFTEFSRRICWNRSLVASGLFFFFTQSNEFYKFHWHILRKGYSSNRQDEKWLLLSANYMAKFELVLVLTQENAFS